MRQEQAGAGDIVLLFADESEALTHPYLAHAWAERGADLRIEAPGQAKKVAIMGALDATTHELIVHTKRSIDFIALLEEIDRRSDPPQPGRTTMPIVLVLDNGPIHTSKLTVKALSQRPWITVEWLPRYAPELNHIELVWRDLKRHHLAHRTFTNIDHLDHSVHQALKALNRERAQPCDNLSIAA